MPRGSREAEGPRVLASGPDGVEALDGFTYRAHRLACYFESMTDPNVWRVCSICRKAIGYGQTYYACGVSTCNRTRTALFFCSMGCWETHLPTARHRDAWAEEKVAPKR